MDKERSLLRKLLPRILKAILMGFLMGGEILLFLLIPGFRENMQTLLPINEYFFFGFMVVFVLFEIVIQLFSETVFKYALSVARTLLSMIYLVLATNGGVVAVNVPLGMDSIGVISDEIASSISVILEFRAVLSVFLIFSLISIAKNVIQAIDFLAKKAERPIIIREIP